MAATEPNLRSASVVFVRGIEARLLVISTRDNISTGHYEIRAMKRNLVVTVHSTMCGRPGRRSVG